MSMIYCHKCDKNYDTDFESCDHIDEGNFQ